MIAITAKSCNKKLKICSLSHTHPFNHFFAMEFHGKQLTVIIFVFVQQKRAVFNRKRSRIVFFFCKKILERSDQNRRSPTRTMGLHLSFRQDQA